MNAYQCSILRLRIRNLLDKRKEFFSEKETEDEEFQDRVYFCIDKSQLYDVMRKAGINVPQTIDPDRYPETEKEDEQINLAQIILQVQGENLNGYKNISCPHCRTKLIAAIGYDVMGKGYNELAHGIHILGEEDALVYFSGSRIDYNVSENRNRDYAAFKCLRCGVEFGKYQLPKELQEEYEKSSE